MKVNSKQVIILLVILLFLGLLCFAVMGVTFLSVIDGISEPYIRRAARNNNNIDNSNC